MRLKAMLAYDWPGNVRELENCLERACALTTGPIISSAICQAPSTARSGCRRMGIVPAKILPMAELEKQAIFTTITNLNGDKLMAARLLGIGKTTFYRKLKEYACLHQ